MYLTEKLTRLLVGVAFGAAVLLPVTALTPGTAAAGDGPPPEDPCPPGEFWTGEQCYPCALIKHSEPQCDEPPCDPMVDDECDPPQCDPEIEDCDPPECDPAVEDCDPPECDPAVEDCDPPECDPVVEDCDPPPRCDPEVEECGDPDPGGDEPVDPSVVARPTFTG